QYPHFPHMQLRPQEVHNLKLRQPLSHKVPVLYWAEHRRLKRENNDRHFVDSPKIAHSLRKDRNARLFPGVLRILFRFHWLLLRQTKEGYPEHEVLKRPAKELPAPYKDSSFPHEE